MATVGQRLANYIIDAIAFYILLMIIMFIGGSALAGNIEAGDGSGIASILIGTYAITFAVIFGYYTLLEGSKGKTLGKLVTKTKVVTQSGEAMTYGKAFLRTLCRLVPFEFISVFLGQKMWHDEWTKTMVVKDK
jgi:uncharacterized RDD family membrane protein YckC